MNFLEGVKRVVSLHESGERQMNNIGASAARTWRRRLGRCGNHQRYLWKRSLAVVLASEKSARHQSGAYGEAGKMALSPAIHQMAAVFFVSVISTQAYKRAGREWRCPSLALPKRILYHMAVLEEGIADRNAYKAIM